MFEGTGIKQIMKTCGHKSCLKTKTHPYFHQLLVVANDVILRFKVSF